MKKNGIPYNTYESMITLFMIMWWEFLEAKPYKRICLHVFPPNFIYASMTGLL
jgi:hypothetical protein